MNLDGTTNDLIPETSPSHKTQNDALRKCSGGDSNNSALVGRSDAVEKAVENVPLEILSEIFSWCCPTYNDPFRGLPFSALMLSHVCRLWRRAALETPGIWTYTKLTVDYSTDNTMQRANEQLKLWLTCVQNCPIVVDAEFVRSPNGKPADNIFNQVETIIEMARKLKPSVISSEMELRAALDASAAVTSPDDDFPLIVEQYSWAKSGMRPDRPLPGSIQLHVNRPADVIYGLEGHSTLGSHLKHLNLRDPFKQIKLSVEECLIAVSNFQQLEFCALDIGESTDEIAEPVTLMRLRTLSLSWSDGVEVAALIDSITAPALGELELKGPLLPREYFPENRWSSLRQFLRRSGPQLWAFSLGKMDCTTLDLLNCLALCEGLQHLSLEECRLDEELMTSLQDGGGPAHEQDRRVLLGLDFLALVSCDIYELNEFLRESSEDPFAWSESNLKRLYIIDCGHISEDVVAAMRELPLERFETSPDELEDKSLDEV